MSAVGIRSLTNKLFDNSGATRGQRILRCLSIVLPLVAGCAHTTRQTTPPRKPPVATSEERAVTTGTDSTREYSGEWESGVDVSVFHGCNGTLPAKVRVSLAPGASEGARWSENAGSAPGRRTYYVRVRGILRGPVTHSGLGSRRDRDGGAEYELYVTRVLEVKPAGHPDCVIRR